MEQRKGGHQPVLGRQLHPVREADPCHRVGAVRLHDELGPAGGARGGDQDGQVVGPDGHLRQVSGTDARGSRVAEQVVDVQHLDGELSACLDDLRLQGSVGDDLPGHHLTDQPRQLVEGGAGIRGNGDGAQGGERQPAQDIGRRRPRRDQDEVTMVHPGVPEPVCEPDDLVGGVAERQRAVVGAEPRRPGVPLDRGGQQPGDGLGRPHCHRPSLADAWAPSNDRCAVSRGGRSAPRRRRPCGYRRPAVRPPGPPARPVPPRTARRRGRRGCPRPSSGHRRTEAHRFPR